MSEFEQFKNTEISEQEIQDEINDLKRWYPEQGINTFEDTFTDQEARRFAELKVKSRKTGSLESNESNEYMAFQDRHYKNSNETPPQFQ